MNEPKYKTPKLITGEDDKLRELIKTLIKQEIESMMDDDVVDEMTGTGAVAIGSTPAWGTRNSKGSPGAIKALKRLGFNVSKSISELSDATDKINEAVSRYKRYKTHPMKGASKVSVAILEVNKMLKEIDFLMSVVERFKEEAGVPFEQLWKRTEDRIVAIKERLKSITTKLRNIEK